MTTSHITCSNLIVSELVGCRHVYQFSKVFVGDQTLSRSASSSVLCTSSQRLATTTASFLPSRSCLISSCVTTPNVPVSNPCEIAPVFVSRPLVRSPSSPVSCRDCLPSLASLPDDASSDEVCSAQLPCTQVNAAAGSCVHRCQSRVQCCQNCVN